MELQDIPKQFEIHSPVFEQTFIFRRRRVKDNIAIGKRQTELLNMPPIYATQDMMRASFIVAELETALVSPEGFDFAEEENEDEVFRIVEAYENWLKLFRAATLALTKAASEPTDRQPGLVLPQAVQPRTNG